jgi:hypothetical protein
VIAEKTSCSDLNSQGTEGQSHIMEEGHEQRVVKEQTNMARRRYEFAIDGSNDVFGQDDTNPELAVGSIREAKSALNEMASDLQWLDEDLKPVTKVELRRQEDRHTVAVFEPHARVAHRYTDGTVSMKVVWRRRR